MKKVRKGKKMLIIILIAIIVIIAAVLVITKVVNKKPKPSETPVEKEQFISLPETTTASGMDAERIYIEYIEDQDKTVLTMRITNNTDKKIENEQFNAILIGPDDNILGQMETATNVDLEIGEQCEVSVIYKGDFTATQRIKLQPKQ